MNDKGFIDKAAFLNDLNCIEKELFYEYCHGGMSQALRQQIDDIVWFIDLVESYPNTPKQN